MKKEGQSWMKLERVTPNRKWWKLIVDGLCFGYEWEGDDDDDDDDRSLSHANVAFTLSSIFFFPVLQHWLHHSTTRSLVSWRTSCQLPGHRQSDVPRYSHPPGTLPIAVSSVHSLEALWITANVPSLHRCFIFSCTLILDTIVQSHLGWIHWSIWCGWVYRCKPSWQGSCLSLWTSQTSCQSTSLQATLPTPQVPAQFPIQYGLHFEFFPVIMHANLPHHLTSCRQHTVCQHAF